MGGSNKTLYKQFNLLLKKALKMFKQLFPEMVEFKIIYLLFKFIKSFDIGKPQRIFQKNLGIHKQYIENEDEDFFLNKFIYKDYTNKKINLSKFFETLKSTWKDIDKVHKDMIWTYTKEMLVISENIQEIKQKALLKTSSLIK